jgi:hypothetical protein
MGWFTGPFDIKPSMVGKRAGIETVLGCGPCDILDEPGEAAQLVDRLLTPERQETCSLLPHREAAGSASGSERREGPVANSRVLRARNDRSADGRGDA